MEKNNQTEPLKTKSFEERLFNLVKRILSDSKSFTESEARLWTPVLFESLNIEDFKFIVETHPEFRKEIPTILKNMQNREIEDKIITEYFKSIKDIARRFGKKEDVIINIINKHKHYGSN